jgi:tRNA (cytidine/uridine-2'-O-)-methyltransferase
MSDHSLAVVLYEPDIPQNTGNIIRLCANTGAELHLIKPLGFPLEDKKLRRAGLDYHEYANIIVHDNWQIFSQYIYPRRIIAIETTGDTSYDTINYLGDDVLLFGSETKGLPKIVLDDLTIVVRIPMIKNQRSLNLSNSVALSLYEAWRQLGFVGGL